MGGLPEAIGELAATTPTATPAANEGTSSHEWIDGWMLMKATSEDSKTYVMTENTNE